MKVHSTMYKVQSAVVWILGTWYLILGTPLFSQQKNLPLNRQWNLQMDNAINKLVIVTPLDSTEPPMVNLDFNYASVHSGFRPLIESNGFRIDQVSGFRGLNWRGNICTKGRGKGLSLFRLKLKYESLITVNDTNDHFKLYIDPLFNFEFGKDNLDDTLNQLLHVNTRGIQIKGDVGEKFSFESSFYENQAFFLSYIDSFNLAYKVVPGQGRWKPFYKTKDGTNDSIGYDYAMASGYVSYSPNKHFNFQVGHGKHFIGDGYRSLLLSDNAFNYPFFRVTSNFGRFQYVNLYTVFMNLTSGAKPIGTEPLFQKRAGVFQYLNCNIHKRVQLGLFQATVADGADYKNNQHLDAAFFSPVIFTNAVAYGLHDSYNVLIGSTIKVKITNSISFYGQYLCDDISKDGSGSIHNRTGFQAGFKYYNMFGVKDLHLQLEFNKVRPYTYAKDTLMDNYSHYNQALAHPLGANFTEGIAFLNYRINDFYAEFRFSYAMTGKDSSGYNFGSDIFKNSQTAFYGPASDINVQNQGLLSTLTYKDFKLGYLVNPAYHFSILIGMSDRQFSNEVIQNHSFYVYFGLRTSLTNNYYDF